MAGDDDVRRRIERSFGDVSAPRPPLERVLRRSRILRVRRYIGGSVLAAVLAAGIALPLVVLGPLAHDPRGRPGIPPRDASGDATPQDEVDVVCDDGTRLLTSSVLRQPDGVHFHLINRDGAGVVFVRDPHNPHRSWARMALADRTVASFVLPIPHGEVLVACLHAPVNTLELPEEAFVPLTILPAGDSGEQEGEEAIASDRGSETEGRKGNPSDEDTALAEDLIRFARSPSPETLDAVPLASDGVWLGLSDRLLVHRSPEELAAPEAWVLDETGGRGEGEGGFRGYDGPFSPLKLLADAGAVTISVGPHRHCASPPIPPPDRVADLRRVSIQPQGGDTCIGWWTVDLFVTREGDIAAVTLDLWEP